MLQYLVGCIYGPNDFIDVSEIKRVFSNAKNFVDENKFSDLLLTGDFNFPKIKWTDCFVSQIEASDNSIESKFKDIVNDEF